jgi:hypothetical protein
MTRMEMIGLVSRIHGASKPGVASRPQQKRFLVRNLSFTEGGPMMSAKTVSSRLSGWSIQVSLQIVKGAASYPYVARRMPLKICSKTSELIAQPVFSLVPPMEW